MVLSVIPVGSRLATIVDDLVDWTIAPDYARYAQIDRGSYDHAPFSDRRLAPLIDRACALTERTLSLVEARVVRLRPGDYWLAHHDPIVEDYPIEIVVDLSPREVPAELHYRRRGQVFFRVPSKPRSVAFVERGPSVTSNHTYLSKRATSEVVRVIALLR